MKFFHLSDLHIGLKLINRDLREDQEYVLDQIVRAAGEVSPDAVVVAGDIYDKAIPSVESVELFDRFVSKLAGAVPTAEIMMISGNHDSGPRVNLFRSVLQRRGIHMVGLPPRTPEDFIEKVVLWDEFGPVNFYLLPFVKPSMVRPVLGADADASGGEDEAEDAAPRDLSYDEALHRLIDRETIDPEQRNVLVSHQFYLPSGAVPSGVERMDSEVRTVGDIDGVRSDVLERFDYAALGHMHKPMEVGNERCRYCGTPLACSVSEAGQQKGIIVVELGEKGSVKTSVLPLTPLREVRVITGAFSEVLGQGCEDYVTVVLTDKEDLDVLDMQDRLRACFPNLLEIRRELPQRAGDRAGRGAAEAEMSPFELCGSFLKEQWGGRELDEEERSLLQDVIDSVQEAH